MIKFLRTHMVGITWGIVTAFVLTLFAGSVFFTQRSENDSTSAPQKSFANIGNIPISEEKFQDLFAAREQNLSTLPFRSVPPDLVEQQRFSAFQEAVQYTLLLNAAKSEGLRATRSDRKTLIQQYLVTFKLKNEGELKKLLAEKQLPYSAFKDQMRDDILVQKMYQKIVSLVTVSDQDVKNKYTEIRVSHLLVPIPKPKKDNNKAKAEAEELAKKKAEKITQELFSGLSFSSAAKKYSEDPGSRNKDGDLGWIRAGMMVPEFENAAFSLAVGEVSSPVRTQYGFHLIKVLEKRELPRNNNLSIDKEKEQILTQKRQNAIQSFLSQMTQGQTVTIRDQWLSATQAKYQGNLAGAVAGYQSMISASPSSVFGHYLLASTYLAAGQVENAQAELQKGTVKLELTPDNKVGPYLYLLLGYLYGNKNPEKMSNCFAKALDLGKDDLTVLEQLKQIYANPSYKGNRDQSIRVNLAYDHLQEKVKLWRQAQESPTANGAR